MKMKMKIWSDLHLEGYWFDYKPEKDDKDTVLVLPGDIGTFKSGLEPFIVEMCDYFKTVIYVMGNHEAYRENLNDIEDKMRSLEETIDNLYFLNNDKLIIDNVRFLGTPLYTQLTPRNQATIEYLINDYRLTRIYDGYENGERVERKIIPADHNYLYEQAVLWLKNELMKSFDGKTVLIFHWGFTHKLTESQYIGQPANPYFNNDLEWLLHSYKIDTLIYGHTHGKIFIDYDEDERFDGTRIINNPRGYRFENDEFDYNRIWEIKE